MDGVVVVVKEEEEEEEEEGMRKCGLVRATRATTARCMLPVVVGKGVVVREA